MVTKKTAFKNLYIQILSHIQYISMNRRYDTTYHYSKLAIKSVLILLRGRTRIGCSSVIYRMLNK